MNKESMPQNNAPSTSTLRKLFPWVALITNLVIYLVLGGLYLILPAQAEFKFSLLLLNLLFSLGLMIKYRSYVQAWWQSNFIRWRAEHLYRLAIICALVALLNLLGTRYDRKFDWSVIGQFQLSPESQQVLKRFTGPIKFTVFGNYQLWEPLIELYRQPQGPAILTERVDPARRPDLVKAYNITQLDTLLVQYRDKMALVDKTEELAITNALIKISRTHVPRVAYTVGHGELDLSKTTPEGGKYLLDLLTQASFAPEALRLEQQNELSSSIDTILILGPAQDFHPGEIKLLDQYIKAGGNLVMALNPRVKKVDLTPNLRKWLRQWNIGLNNTLVIDRIQAVQGSQGMMPLVSELAVHPITRGLEGQTFFPVTSAVENLAAAKENAAKEEAPGPDEAINFVALAKTLPFPASWADRRPWEMLQGGRIKYDEGQDIPGPITMAAAVTVGKSRMAIFGTSALWQNSYQAFLANFGLLLNAVAWQTEEDLL
ncbi:MAG: Gldg family protein, partial [Bacteriovoracaceae bacterium]|nr:Gldg family protein [Bacteriovoracaceae bacterium]